MEGQLKIKARKVLCVGAGGLGSPLALYLAAAGVGTIGIVDFDVVDYTNLQRQIIHTTADVGRKKLDSAAEKLKAINPFRQHREVRHPCSTAPTRWRLFKDFDIIADGTDNFPDALSGQRCLRAHRQAERLRVDFPLRRSGQCLRYARMARATAACIPNRHRRGWFPPAPKVECWEFCPDCSA